MPTAAVTDPLNVAALEIERYVSRAGWDQPPRVFALVRSKDLLAAEPTLAAALGHSAGPPDALTGIEQDGLPEVADVESLLGQLAWPESVDGVAIALERIVLPPDAEREMPQEPQAAADYLQAHPDRADIRLTVAVLRDGQRTALIRQRAHDHDDLVASSPDLAPGLTAALQATLEA